jgi:hypothetical protein
MQSRKRSAIETVANVAVGYIAAVTSQFAIYPMFGIHVSPETHILIGGWFTVTSLVRSYAMRRLFNRWQEVR